MEEGEEEDQEEEGDEEEEEDEEDEEEVQGPRDEGKIFHVSEDIFTILVTLFASFVGWR